MRYFKYIAILAVLFMTASCTESDFAGQGSLNKGDKIQIVGRVLPFTDCNVDSRSVKADNEINIACMSLVIFDNNGTCVHLEYIGSNNPVFVLKRDDLAEKYDLSNAKIYVFANTPAIQPGDKLSTSSSEADFLATANEVSGINIPKIGDIECFPMIGELTVNLENQPENVLEIPLYALYAKIVMNIKVTPDQTVEKNLPPRFIVEGYEVHNVAKSVDFNGGTINSSNDATEVLSETFEGSIEGINVAQGSNEVQFSFYLPERFLLPNTSAANYAYPFKGTDGTIREEDEKYRQRFKPCLVEATTDKEAQKATFVRFFGEFIDHQGHNYNVSYDIYVGNDNYSNFDVVRNTQYNNYITIRGLANSNDQATNEDAISIDHRVDVERVNPIIINFRRETLLDSHFEVRPLRVHATSDVSTINAVKVEVVNPETTNWMRLERSFGDGTAEGSITNSNGESIYITDNGASYGKRRYFTYNLIDGVDANEVDATLQSSTEVILPLSTETTECCWIYVDENTTVGDDVRTGTIKVTYGTLNGTTFTATTDTDYQPLEYVINQRNLFQVTYDSRTYNIEYHEEYLYNYDAEDSYGQTEYEGMQWGLPNVQLSYDYRSAYISESGGFLSWLLEIFGGSMTDFINNHLTDISAKYDFYIERDKNENPNATVHNYNGYNFCNDIIQEVNGAFGNDNDATNNIDVLQLNQQPRSAIEYCYNKNKRNNLGHVIWEENDSYNQSQLNWYLPAIDEIEDIVMSKYSDKNVDTYSRFIEFQDKYYWSSQPAYDKYDIYIHTTISGSTGSGRYYEDDLDRARATKVTYNQTNNTYDNEESGVEGIIGTNSYEVETYILYTKVHKEGLTESSNTITYDNGNLSRTDMARVRCVRKATTNE